MYAFTSSVRETNGIYLYVIQNLVSNSLKCEFWIFSAPLKDSLKVSCEYVNYKNTIMHVKYNEILKYFS